ncbi:MAG TPA: primosomal protein N' [Gammaproteobacteria bacterium]|nr:primosomal protein N' [Gammaproteobacteria bacterium]
MHDRPEHPATANQPIWRIAVAAPLHKGFDYHAPRQFFTPPTPGIRVLVPFGRRSTVGILLETRDQSAVDARKLKPVSQVIDETPVLTPDLLTLGRWAADYYHHPAGEVLHHMLPTLLRRGEPAARQTENLWRLTPAGMDFDAELAQRAPKQQALLKLLQQHAAGLTSEALNQRMSQWRAPMQALLKKQLVHQETIYFSAHSVREPRASFQHSPDLNNDQRLAVQAIGCSLDGFKRWLLEGVTGSGKTEVYLHVIEQVLAMGRQALVLVPEIGLTPQLLQRFEERLPVPIAVMHSDLGDRERLNAWLAARGNEARVIIGTRSAVFTPLAKPGIIIVDEEHDHSFKQQEGWRYHARDLAVVRAQQLDIPVVLGSATPSLESLHNCLQARYQRLHLPARTGQAQLPRIGVVDARRIPLDQPVSSALLQRVREHLEAGNQALIFLNRRGYAPVYICHDCGWHAECRRCDAHLTVHRASNRLRCHHCGSERPLDTACPSCNGASLLIVGLGTEQMEDFFSGQFPGYEIVRIDRDTTRRKGSLERSLQKAQSGQARILIGTQMLAKGHHFPQVTCVGILGIDQALFSADFRSTEYMAQLVTQVSGRAGRAERPGEVLIESHQPQHPLLQLLITRGYREFADAALEERQAAGLPPYTRMVLVRAEAPTAGKALQFLSSLRAHLQSRIGPPVALLGPAPAPMERRAGRYRAQLLLQSDQARALHNALDCITLVTEQLPERRSVRWSIDVDPVEMF